MLNDPVKRGEYLVTLGHCMVCHTPKGDAGLDMRQRGAGGHSFEGRGAWSSRATSRRIATTASARGATPRSRPRSRRASGPNGTALKPPMPYALYASMSDQDLDAVVAYLRTIPAKQ